MSANNTFGYASDFVIYTDPQNNTQVHLTCIEPNNGASSYDTYDITNISNANQSIDTMYHETFGDFFPGAQATNILTEASSSIMSNGDVVTFVTAQSQNISFNSYIK